MKDIGIRVCLSIGALFFLFTGLSINPVINQDAQFIHFLIFTGIGLVSLYVTWFGDKK